MASRRPRRESIAAADGAEQRGDEGGPAERSHLFVREVRVNDAFTARAVGCV
jgi:hypothetical protein